MFLVLLAEYIRLNENPIDFCFESYGGKFEFVHQTHQWILAELIYLLLSESDFQCAVVCTHRRQNAKYFGWIFWLNNNISHVHFFPFFVCILCFLRLISVFLIGIYNLNYGSLNMGSYFHTKSFVSWRKRNSNQANLHLESACFRRKIYD